MSTILNPGDIFASVIRTGVPLIVGWLIAVPVVAGLDLDAALVSQVVEFVVTMAYYALFRALETRVDGRFGWLLGLAKPPKYDDELAPDPDVSE